MKTNSTLAFERMMNAMEMKIARLHASGELLGTVRLNRKQQIKHAFAQTPEGIFAAGDVFNDFVLRRLGVGPEDYIRLEEPR